ncbi:unnamed protein product [Schistocephalus solidus]|uniref:Uncharacterized protein n=1 Tax=Schistocephalus solidus TaxID=70667 RepID=A0A3P7CK20_SCHSO|nr:unnamed protein product [Schistocephalus solidus]
MLDISLSNLSVLDKEPLSPIRHRASTGMAPLGLRECCHEYLEFASQAKANAHGFPISEPLHSRHSSCKTVNQITEYINQFCEPTDELRLATALANNTISSEAYELPTELREIDECDTSPDRRSSLMSSSIVEENSDLNKIVGDLESDDSVAIRKDEKQRPSAVTALACNTSLTVFQLNEAMRASDLCDFDGKTLIAKMTATANIENGGNGDEEYYEGLLKTLGLNGAKVRKVS